MQHSPRLSPSRCSVLRPTGNLCGAAVLEGAPFPVCEHHAKRLYAFMLETRPPRDPTVAEQKMDLLDRARDQRIRWKAKADEAYAAQSVVYYLRHNETVKIGFTTNMQARLNGLHNTVGNLLATEPGGRQRERERHVEFADERIGKREDFIPTERLLAHIDAMRAEHGEPRVTGYIQVA